MAIEKLSGADALMRSLKEEGVELIFGYPGGASLHIYDALFNQEDIEHILVRHEQGAVHAADGYAMACGKPGVVFVTSGPGATNAITGLATAYMDSIPVVVISGQVKSHLIGTDSFQETDMIGVSRPIVKHSFLAQRAEDIPEIVKIAKKNNIITIADNSWASFIYCNPFKLGVDIVIEAATKYINGHADILLGLIASNKKYSNQIRSTAKGYGINSGSDELYLSIRGLRTMMLRIEESQKNALILARYLNNHKLVSKVFHPAIKTHHNHKIWKRDFKGSSGLFGIEMKKKYSKIQLKKFFNKLKIFELGYSWGSYESLVTFPSLEERKINKYKGSIIRIHCGLEDIKDLILDMENALKALK